MNIVGIDFEMANTIPGSLCAYGLVTEDTLHYSVMRLHPVLGGEQERTRYHRISADLTQMGSGPEDLYSRLVALPEGTILAAHDARIDRGQLRAWFDMWDLPPLYFSWIDTLKIAQRHFGKTAKTGIAAMAERMDIWTIPHQADYDARVSREIALRYDWGNIQVFVDKAPERV